MQILTLRGAHQSTILCFIAPLQPFFSLLYVWIPTKIVFQLQYIWLDLQYNKSPVYL